MKKTITAQLRELGYSNEQIKAIHNRHFRYDRFKDFQRVERCEYGLRFYDDVYGMIFEIAE